MSLYHYSTLFLLLISSLQAVILLTYFLGRFDYQPLFRNCEPALLPRRFFSGKVDLTRESGRNRAYFLDWLLPVPSCFIRTVKGQVNFCGMVEWKYSNWFLSLINDQEERPNTHLKNNDNAIFFFQDACIEMLRSHDCSESQANTTMRSVNFVFYFNA